MLNNPVPLWKNTQYVYLVSSQLVSSLGDWLDLLALFALVGIKWEVSPIEVTYLMLCFSVPMIVFGPFAGILADRFDRKILMIIADIFRAIAVIGIIFASSIWILYGLILIKSSFSAIFLPAKNGKLKEIVPDEQMQQAIAISGMIDNGSKVVGPMISGLVVASIGVHFAFYLDAGTFLLSALLLFGVKGGRMHVNLPDKLAGTEKKQFLSEIKVGIAYIKTIPVIYTGLILLSIALLVLQIADTQFIILLREMAGSPIETAGYAMAACGAGMFVMSAILSKKKFQSVISYLSFGTIGIGAGFAAVALVSYLPETLIMLTVTIIFFLVGIAAGATFVPFNVCVQRNTPVHMSGRVFGTINSVTTGATIIGMVIGGILVEAFGVRPTFFGVGIVLIIIGIGAIIRPALKGSEKFAESKQGVQRKA